LSESIRAVERALNVLLCFSRQTPQLTMTQLAERLGMNKSAVHRHLATLERKRFVQRDPATGVYQLGIRLLQMAYLTLEHNDLRRLAAPFLRRLCDEYRETVDLAVLDDADVLFLDVVESPQRVKLAAAIGQRLPAYATASGKAILALMPEGAVRHILAHSMPSTTEHAARSPEILLEDLRQIRERGFALAVEEYEYGINAVAASILDSSQQPIASVSVAGPTYRLTLERMLEIGPAVLAAAREIARELEMAAAPAEPSTAEPSTGRRM
jgi:IclR family acetate operon transcriptional repressor